MSAEAIVFQLVDTTFHPTEEQEGSAWPLSK